MKVIKPTIITDALFVSSTVPETDYAEWSAATSYTVGQKCIRVSTHRIYENLVSGVNATAPESSLTGTTPRWLDIGSTNLWAMFDGEVGSQTSATSSLSVVIQPGLVTSLTLLELEGATVTITMQDGTETVYTHSQSLDATIYSDWSDYFFTEYVPKTELVLDNLPLYGSGKITVTLAGGGTVKCGALIVGMVKSLGDTMSSAKSGIIDYSKKETNVFGVTSIIERRYSRRVSAQVVIESSQINRVQKLLADVRATPCVWIGSDEENFGNLIVYGFYRDFEIDVAYQDTAYCSLSIEGLI